MTTLTSRRFVGMDTPEIDSFLEEIKKSTDEHVIPFSTWSNSRIFRPQLEVFQTRWNELGDDRKARTVLVQEFATQSRAQDTVSTRPLIADDYTHLRRHSSPNYLTNGWIRRNEVANRN